MLRGLAHTDRLPAADYPHVGHEPCMSDTSGLGFGFSLVVFPGMSCCPVCCSTGAAAKDGLRGRHEPCGQVTCACIGIRGQGVPKVFNVLRMFC